MEFEKAMQEAMNKTVAQATMEARNRRAMKAAVRCKKFAFNMKAALKKAKKAAIKKAKKNKKNKMLFLQALRMVGLWSRRRVLQEPILFCVGPYYAQGAYKMFGL